MRIIAITSPKVCNEDVYIIKSLLKNGIDIIDEEQLFRLEKFR